MRFVSVALPPCLIRLIRYTPTGRSGRWLCRPESVRNGNACGSLAQGWGLSGKRRVILLFPVEASPESSRHHHPGIKGRTRWKDQRKRTTHLHPDRPTAVVGGSAAGLFTASLLARAGRAVRIFERAERLDPAHRTLIVTHRMRELLGPLAERAVVNEIRRFELFTDGRSATVPLDRPDLIIERVPSHPGTCPGCRGAWRAHRVRPALCLAPAGQTRDRTRVRGKR